MFSETRQDFVSYPTNRTSAFFDHPSEVQKVINELTHHGIQRELIEVQAGPQAIRTIDIEGRRHGMYGRVLRFWQKLLRTGEWLHLEQAREELQKGHWMVNVLTQAEKEKNAAVEAMKRCGGHGIRYFNNMYVEHLQ